MSAGAPVMLLFMNSRSAMLTSTTEAASFPRACAIGVVVVVEQRPRLHAEQGQLDRIGYVVIADVLKHDVVCHPCFGVERDGQRLRRRDLHDVDREPDLAGG